MQRITYTNVILTVIAVCLIALVFRDHDVIPTALAQAPAQRVVIVGWQGDGKGVPVDIKNSLVPVANGWGSTGKLVPMWTTEKEPN
jgi:hypothetical protein